MRKKRKRKDKGRFKDDQSREAIMKRVVRNRKRLKDLRYRQAVESMMAQFSSRGGKLTDKQWSYLRTIDKAPLYRKPATKKMDLNAIQPAVYAIASRQYIKIGKSHSVQKRLASIQTGNAEHLRIICQEDYETHQQALNREQALHRHFASNRVRGEWFDISIKDELVMMMNEAKTLQ